MKKIYGSKHWPSYKELGAELHTYSLATKGINDLKKEIGAPLIHRNKTNVRMKKGLCYICGDDQADHLSRNCPQPPRLCSICGRRGHIDKYCWEKEERKQKSSTSVARKPQGKPTEKSKNEEQKKSQTKNQRRVERKNSSKSKVIAHLTRGDDDIVEEEDDELSDDEDYEEDGEDDLTKS
jgi:hypothetical protein